MGYVLVLLGASLAVGSPPARNLSPAAAPSAVHKHRAHWWRRVAGAEPALALRLSSWGIGREHPAP